MASESSLLSLAGSVADGRPVDWDTVESQATPEERDVVRQLRVVANLSQLHRSLPDVPASPTHRMPSLSVPALGTWGHLSVLERLGGGAFADVFRAWDRELEREVALKLLRAEPDHADPVTSRIAEEGRLLARVRHPNVVTVHGVATHQGRVGLWMELVHGETLEAQLHARGPLGATEAAVVGMELCRALAAIHQAGLVHRDVKAQNVMREHGGRIVLMDLGTGHEADAAAGEGPARIAGTPLYLAPELLIGAPATPSTDLYSLGVLLYRLVTGAFPVEAATIEELHAKHSGGRLVPLRDVRPDLPSAFVRVIDRAIAADPNRRYASAGALESDLARAVEEDTHAPRTGVVTRPGSRRGQWAVLAVAAVIVAVVAARGWLWPSNASPSSAVPPGVVRSVAVLPLANLSGNPAQDYFAAGITDELIGTLGRLQGLNVISSTSVASFKDSKTPLKEIARTLNVDAVIEGSVFVQPGRGNDADAGARRVRVNARLIYAGTDTQIWNQTFEAAMSDVLSIQSRIATAVAQGVSLRLSEQQQSALVAGSAGGTQDPAAFDLYLHGRYYWNMRTNEGLRRSIQYFQEAIDRDPRSARAYAGLADAYSLLGAYEMMPRADAESAALAAAMKAVALDDSLAEAHASIGLVRMRRFEWKAAEAEFRRSIALKPSYAAAHRWLATWLAKQGRMPDAIAEIKTALEQDPLSVGSSATCALILAAARRYDEALAQVQKAIRMEPGFTRGRMQLAEIYAFQRQYARALMEAEAAAASAPSDLELLADLGYIRAVAGRRADALKVRDDLLRRARANEDAAAGGVAIIYVGLGDADRAFEWLGRARDIRDPAIEWVKVDPRFDRLRPDPRFTRLLNSAGLAQ